MPARSTDSARISVRVVSRRRCGVTRRSNGGLGRTPSNQEYSTRVAGIEPGINSRTFTPSVNQRRGRAVDPFAVFRRAAERRARSNTTLIGTAVSDGTPASVASQITAAATVIVQTTTTMLTTSGLPFITDPHNDCRCLALLARDR